MKKKLLSLLMALSCFVGTAYAADYMTLEIGSRGDAVLAVQNALAEQGFLATTPDGVFGNNTSNAVSNFQQSVGLEATGIADELTQRKLFNDEEEDISEIEVNVTGDFETDYMRVDGMLIDESYVDEKNQNMTMLYVFYTAFTNSENLRVDSTKSEMVINGINAYTSEHYCGACTYLENYYYSDYLRDVYVGDEFKIVETFKVPKGELAPGRTMTFSSSQIPDSDKISLVTDDIVTCGSAKTIAKIMDPDGYASMEQKLAPADADTVAKVKRCIIDYYWDWYCDPMTYRIYFYDGTYKLVSTVKGSSISATGSYTVRNGYLVLVTDGTNAVRYVSYSWGADDIDLDGLVAAYDYHLN